MDGSAVAGQDDGAGTRAGRSIEENDVPVRLWDDDVEAMRDEARDAVDTTMPALMELLGRGESAPARAPLDRDEQVARSRAAMAQIYAPAPEGVAREIAGVPCRVFTPDTSATTVYLHFHGGGMILGAPEMSDPTNVALMRDFGVAVVSVDYRLAPEHPYPAGPDDGLAVAAWLLEHGADEFGSDRILVGGESAGGYMAAVVLLRIRDELHAADRIDGANLVFGVYDWGRSPSQRGVGRPVDGVDILDPVGIEFFTECYLPGKTDDERRDPVVSPMFADLRDLPPVLMTVGTRDHLLDDTLTLSTRWAAAGNEVELLVLPEMPHGFQAFPCAMTKWWEIRTNRWFADILARRPGSG